MQNSSSKYEYILTVACKDVSGIVAAVTGFIASSGGFIIEAAQFGDATTGQFFQRIHFKYDEGSAQTPQSDDALREAFSFQVGKKFNMDFAIHNVSKKPRLLIMVSKFDHCLHDLLHRHQAGSLDVEIPAIASNHPDLKRIADWYEIPYFHLPIENGDKPSQEAKILDIIAEYDIDLVVLARYMQILSPELSAKLHGKAINIHHSFLPSFKGARPYHQAHAKGVKLIGATAHYVTDDLDEGPIIEQEVARVDHTLSPEDFVATGQDIERRVLFRAVKYHIERRVLLNESKTVVF